jgi:hypothetical protein
LGASGHQVANGVEDVELDVADVVQIRSVIRTFYEMCSEDALIFVGAGGAEVHVSEREV